MDHDKQTNPFITAEAERILDLRFAELRQQLIQIAIREKAIDASIIKEITASDISNALAKLTFSRENVARQNLRMLQSWRALRTIIAAMSLLIILANIWTSIASANLVGEADKLSSVISMIFGVTALALALYTFRASRYTARETEEISKVITNASDESFVLLSWRELEHAMRNKVAEVGNTSDTRTSLRATMQKYAALAGLSSEEYGELTYILEARNRLTHAPTDGKNVDLDKVASLLRKHLRHARTMR